MNAAFSSRREHDRDAGDRSDWSDAGACASGLSYRGDAIALTSPTRTSRATSRCRSVTSITSSGLGLDCRYCHTSVEKARFAGIPPTETCMTCHSQIWTNAQMLAPVRDEPGQEQADALAARPPAARLRLFRSFAFTSPKASAAPPATAPWTRCR